MSIHTVTGNIEVEEMGITLPHEHIFIDLRNQFSEFLDTEKQEISRQKVDINNLGRLRLNPYAIKDNLVLDEFDIAVKELMLFKKEGGNTIVDCTSIGINRQAKKLKNLSLITGVNIIAGSGYYTQDTHPFEMGEWSPERIADNILKDFIDGIDDTNVKAGIIGEIGTSKDILPNEKKNLLAAAIAYKQIEAPIYIHTYPWGQAGLEAVNILLDNQVDPEKLVVCHIDVEPDINYLKALLSKGIYIEFDNFGKEFVIPPSERGFAGGIFIRDIERIKLIKNLINLGYTNRLLMTNDICLKSMLCSYSGWGYAHILKNIIPLMEYEGLEKEIIEQIIVDNPVNIFK
jgi:phosphotriesterase-related protein